MAWVVIAAGDTDADSPVDATLMGAIRGNLIDLDERIGVQENLISRSDDPHYFTETAFGAGGAGKICFEEGARHEIARADSNLDIEAIHRGFVSYGIRRKIKSAGGKGRFTCSMHMKRVAAAAGVVGGTLSFGLWDGAAFIAGAYADIAFDDVTQEYQRFFFISDQITQPAALNLRSEWVAEPSNWGAINNGDLVGHNGGYMATNGSGLAKWDISHYNIDPERIDTYSGDSHNLFYWWDENITTSLQTVV